MRLAAALLLLLPLGACTHFENAYMRDTTASPSPAPKDDEAVVVIFRPSTFGGNTQFPIFEVLKEEANLMGFAESGSYFEYRCPAGRHTFFTWGEGYCYIEAELAPKKTYYVRCFAKFGFISPRPRFDPVNAGSEEWKKLDEELKGLKFRELDPVKSAAIEESQEEKATKMKSAIAEGRKAPTYLKPDDGR
ncbi:MAG TPA: hypothetical protein VE981_18475 [Planctomycetota bacterium]|nr:hypothetical protein [Planctomycetota bacterium]